MMLTFLQGKAYDVTEFLPEHPGGPKIILKYAVSVEQADYTIDHV